MLNASSQARPFWLLSRRFASLPGPWKALRANGEKIVAASMPLGIVPDWTLWRGGRLLPDREQGSVGSYDAIRVYLWLGMLDARDPLRARAGEGPLALWRARGVVPERFDARSPRRATGKGPAGFLAALLPLEPKLRAELDAALAGAPYYDQALALFGEGFADGRFRFARDGKLLPRCKP